MQLHLTHTTAARSLLACCLPAFIATLDVPDAFFPMLRPADDLMSGDLVEIDGGGSLYVAPQTWTSNITTALFSST